jgi:hypothetical protein
MGETTDELRQAVDNKRDDAAQKIDQIEQRVGETANHMKESLDWRRQVEEKPLVAVGAAFFGGMMLGGVLGGGNGHDQQPKQPPQWQSAAAGAGLGGAIRKAAKSSGLEDSFNEMTSNLFSTISDRMKQMTSEKFPSLAGDSSKSDEGKSGMPSQAPRPAGSSFAG